MRLTFVGHACALLEFSQSRVLTDPYSSVIGYQPVDTEADLVTLSHSNPKWHSCLDDVTGAFQLFEGLSHLEHPTQVKGIQLEAIRVFEALFPGHDESEAEGGEGPNAMIKISGNGIRVLHMGDVGHRISEATLKACGEVDILLAPAGAEPTIDLGDLLDFIAKLRPRIVVPIHFGVPNLAMSLLPVDALIAKWNGGEIVRHSTSTLDVEPILAESAPSVQLHLLPPQRLNPI